MNRSISIYTGVLRPVIKEIKNSIIKTTKRTFAIHAAVPAIPMKPNIPAMIATIKKVSAHDNNIGRSPFHLQ
jgi:hypothetical protein